MVRYFFHVCDGDEVICDEEGTELLGLEEARFEARMSARDLLLQEIAAGQEVDGRRIEIADEHGTVLETVALRDVMLGEGTRHR